MIEPLPNRYGSNVEGCSLEKHRVKEAVIMGSFWKSYAMLPEEVHKLTISFELLDMIQLPEFDPR